ncbi:ABC transporter substrate-binding protein [uncultured Litoreibacter sp.]|uniref:ABC transporter substrate-binding protein n=1 Tax=uncultured Litoreibacter sp. TaxID=1392394 RepID=UPI00261223D2|nr:ABC transporter substrate-binding protein [uncultured Litoreibacter sp.]
MDTKALLLTGTMISAAAAIPSIAFAEGDTIRIGALYPTSGPCQLIGEYSLRGTEILVEEINAAGGLNGKKLELAHRDSKCDPAEATAMARDLIARENVDFLVGGVSSSVGQAISEVSRQEETIYVAAIPKSTQMTSPENFHKYVFRAAANTNTEGKSAAVIADRLGMDKICTILMDYSYGHSLNEAFSEHIAKIRPGAEIVQQEWPKNGTTDYTAHITNIMAAGCDGVFSGVWAGLFPAFAKQAAPFGFFDQVKYVTAGEVGSPEVAEQMGADMPEGIWANSYEVFYHSPNDAHGEFVAKLQEELGVETTPSWPVVGYVASQWLTEAIAKAGSAETDAVIAALEGLTIETPIGTQTMRAKDHQANRGQFWGQMAQSDDAAYPYRKLDPVEYIVADELMD